MQLGFLPLVEAGLVDTDHLIADCKSGVSGAGRKAELNLIFPEAADNFAAYGVKGHRHLPEIVQGLNRASRKPVKLAFTPHLTPMIRGIFATLYAPLKRPGYRPAGAVREALRRRAVRRRDAARDRRRTRARCGRANVCRIAVHRPPGTDLAMILAVEDNLVKGAAGQAIQNMNLMFGLPETTGLDRRCRSCPGTAPAWRPPTFARCSRQFSISAPRMAVRTHLAWPWRLAIGRRVRRRVAGMWWWGFDFGQLLGGFNRGENEQRHRDADADTADGAARGRRASRAEHAARKRARDDAGRAGRRSRKQQAEALQENAQLKEELAFFQQFFADSTKAAGVGIQRLALDGNGRDVARYSVLVVRGGSTKSDFDGHVALAGGPVPRRTATRRQAADRLASGRQARSRAPLKLQIQVLSTGRRHAAAARRATCVRTLTARAYEVGVAEPAGDPHA